MKALRNKQTQEITFIESSVNQDLYVWERLIEPASDDESEPQIEYSDYELIDIEPTDQILEDLLNKKIRPTRDYLLQEADKRWLEKMSKGEDVTELNVYKQALRDFPEELDLSGIDYIDEIEWPAKPE